MKFKLGILMLVTFMAGSSGLLQAQDQTPEPAKKNLSCWTGIVQAPVVGCTGLSFQVGNTFYQLTGNTAGLEIGKKYNLEGTVQGPDGTCQLSSIKVSAQTC